MKQFYVFAAYAILMVYNAFLKACLKFSGLINFLGFPETSMGIDYWVESKAEEVVFAISRSRQRIKAKYRK